MDYNSRYRNGNDSMNTIRTNTGEYGGYDDMDIMEQESAQKKNQVRRASQARGGSSRGRKSRRQMLIYAIIIALEIIALIVIWSMYFSYNSKLKDGGSKSSKKKTEAQQEGPTPGSVNVDNDNFALTCTKISITADSTGAPAAVVYFTFVNKTDTPLSMSQVYAPAFTQAGQELSTSVTLAEDSAEIYNKDTQVSSGQSIECAYAATLVDTTSEITITMHDNYETFADIGYVTVPIS